MPQPLFSKHFFEYGPSNAGYQEAHIILGEYKSGEEFHFSFARNEDQQLVENINLAPYSTKIIQAQAVLTSAESVEKVNSFKLHQNYPNPFNPTTTISFYLPQAEDVKLKVFDITGRLVSTLINEIKPAGEHSVQFDASNISSGVYFYMLENNTGKQVRSMLLIK